MDQYFAAIPSKYKNKRQKLVMRYSADTVMLTLIFLKLYKTNCLFLLTLIDKTKFLFKFNSNKHPSLQLLKKAQ